MSAVESKQNSPQASVYRMESKETDSLKKEIEQLKEIIKTQNIKIMAMYKRFDTITPICEVCKGRGICLKDEPTFNCDLKYDYYKTCPCIEATKSFKKIMDL
jgi:hypothetical protein